jgi:hypothetical protein
MSLISGWFSFTGRADAMAIFRGAAKKSGAADDFSLYERR